MRRFLVSSSKFTGTAELVYNDQGILCRIDTTQCCMDEITTKHFKGAVAPHVDNLGSSFTAGTIVVETTFEVTFEMFWDKYNYKVEKKRTFALWNKLSKTSQVKAYFSIDGYERFLKRKPGLDKKFPDTYLRTEAYETIWDKIN